MKNAPIALLEAQFNRAHISEKDFKEAEEYLKALTRTRRLTVQRALLLAAIIAYCRPFTQNEKRPESKATSQVPINPQKVLDPQEYDLHLRLLDLRNQALAHSEFSRKPTGRVMATSSGFLTSSKPFDVLSERIDRTMLKRMSKKLALHCSAKMFELNSKMGPLA